MLRQIRFAPTVLLSKSEAVGAKRQPIKKDSNRWLQAFVRMEIENSHI